MCGKCFVKDRMNCFKSEIKRACIRCKNLIYKKTFCTDINMLKRQRHNGKHQVFPHYIGEYEPEQNSVDFESTREFYWKNKNGF